MSVILRLQNNEIIFISVIDFVCHFYKIVYKFSEKKPKSFKKDPGLFYFEFNQCFYCISNSVLFHSFVFFNRSLSLLICVKSKVRVQSTRICFRILVVV